MESGTAHAPTLAYCAGFDVVATDGPLGTVVTPLFPADAAEPDFLVLRVGTGSRVRTPVVSTRFVDGVDVDRRVVSIRGSKYVLADLPEHLPIAQQGV